MTMIDTIRFPRLKLGLLLFLAGMLGVVALTVTVLPQVLGDASLPLPSWFVLMASIAQSGLLVALAVWLGVLLAPKVGLSAPAFEAAVTRQSVAVALRPQLLPGLLGGLLGGLGLFAIGGYAPAELADVEQPFTVPLVARVLYGGITEELLLRWGLMTVLVWMAWRLLQRRKGTPQIVYMWFAIVVSALLFGAGHLPAAAAQVGALTADLVAFVVGANAVFGVLFGSLFWRYGLEAAIIAHAFAHVVSHVVSIVVA
ncbi:CPBP family glutamic-type intramembrane protease [Halomonas sp. HL-93]|uniref:CPBP family glutamic-type intramembrane protease n=1 Tax=Halomonas sp. HL-93 TaxID=1666906 RepID=UPI0006DB3B7F|nr:CPBP family intramembrane glutamic endopeptidase [Halomonas sp. HL-93]KPQ26927.1 MAG: CAAX protease self-immunity [Halomonas sp. HL-93]SBR47192.1 CAAX protease self-immunity [Halomonas sp. HL-93]